MAERHATPVNMPAMSVNEIISQVRGLIDWVLGICLWLTVTTIVVVFIASVGKDVWRLSIPFIPTMDYMKLVYAAGVVWLLKNTKV